jgi:chromosome segregation ATPase
MFLRKNLLGFVILLIVAISVPSCSHILPEETKEVKLEKKRDELVKAKENAVHDPVEDQVVQFIYKNCGEQESLREESKDCNAEKEKNLKRLREKRQKANDHVEEIRREIKELEQSGSANKNSSK